MGNTSATIMPEIITEATLLNTERLPLCSRFRVDRGTIRPWLML